MILRSRMPNGHAELWMRHPRPEWEIHVAHVAHIPCFTSRLAPVLPLTSRVPVPVNGDPCICARCTAVINLLCSVAARLPSTPATDMNVHVQCVPGSHIIAQAMPSIEKSLLVLVSGHFSNFHNPHFSTLSTVMPQLD